MRVHAPPSLYFGRENELIELEAARRDAARYGVMSLVTGEAGIGKSRLIAEFLARLPQRTPTVLEGRCVEYLRAPYRPFATLLEQLRPGSGVALQRAADAGRGKAEQFDLVASTLRAAGERQNTIAVIEDAHWADDGTLELLDFVAQALPAMRRVLMVVTAREGREFLQSISTLGRKPAVRALHLGGIAEEAMRSLVRFRLDAPARTQREDSIVALACGNPYYAQELCEAPADDLIPRSLRAVSESRIDALTAGEREALGVLSIFSDHAPLEAISAVLQRDAASTAALLERVEREAIVKEHAGEYVFDHALTREIAARKSTLAQRIEWHRCAALYFESQVERDDLEHLTRLAFHFAQAHVREPAYRYASAAGDMALRVHAYADAARFYEDAAGVSAQGSFERAQALRFAGDAYFRAGEPLRAKSSYRRALLLYSALQAPDEAASLYLNLVRSAYNSGDTAEAIALAREALAAVPEMNAETRADLQANIGFGLSNYGKPLEALSELEQISKEALSANGSIRSIYYSARCGALAAIGDIDAWRRDIVEWAGVAERFLADGPRIGNFGGIATDALFLGESAISQEFFARAMALSRKVDVPLYEAIFASHAAYERWLQGDREGARRLLTASRMLDSDVPAHWAFRATVALLCNDITAIDAHVVDRAIATAQPAIFGPLAGWYARVLVRRGNVQQATALLYRSLAHLGHPYCAWDVGIAVAEFGAEHEVRRAQQLFGEFRASRSAVHRGSAALIDALAEGRFERNAHPSSLFAAAEDAFASVGWRPYVEMIHGFLAASGAGRSPLETLSDRERQVGDLLIEGRTNRQIAQHLAISEKTVEKHVASLLRQLDVKSRSAAAAILARNAP